jgi:hypothetical protein
MKVLSLGNRTGRTLRRMGNPLVGNSLFAIALAALHAPPMVALLWAQRWLRRRLQRPLPR